MLLALRSLWEGIPTPTVFERVYFNSPVLQAAQFVSQPVRVLYFGSDPVTTFSITQTMDIH